MLAICLAPFVTGWGLASMGFPFPPPSCPTGVFGHPSSSCSKKNLPVTCGKKERGRTEHGQHSSEMTSFLPGDPSPDTVSHPGLCGLCLSLSFFHGTLLTRLAKKKSLAIKWRPFEPRPALHPPCGRKENTLNESGWSPSIPWPNG